MLIGLGRVRLDNRTYSFSNIKSGIIKLFINTCNICSSLWPYFRFLVANMSMAIQGPTESATQLLHLLGISGDHKARLRKNRAFPKISDKKKFHQ